MTRGALLMLCHSTCGSEQQSGNTECATAGHVYQTTDCFQDDIPYAFRALDGGGQATRMTLTSRKPNVTRFKLKP
ncbi:hypothetical protein GCM10027287_41840 [Bordetella muralis]